MLKFRLFLPSLLFLTVFSLPSFAEDWIKFTPKTGDYSVLLPGEPKLNELAKNDTSFYIYNYYTNEQEPNKLYTIQCFHLNVPKGGSLTLDDINELLAVFKDDILKDSSNRIIEEKRIKSKEGCPGLEVDYITAKENEYNILKCFVAGKNLTLVSVQTNPEYKDNGNITKFFNSLELYEAKPGAFKENKPKAEWKQFVSEYGGFSVLYPGDPTATNIGDSAKFVNEFIYEPTDNLDVNFLYQTLFLKFDLDSNEYEDAATGQSILNSVKSGYLRDSRYNLLSDHQIIKDGHYGIELKLQAKVDDFLLTARFYVVNNHLIGSRVYTTTGNDNNENMMKFLNSLVIFNRDSLNDIARSKVVWSEFKPESGVFTVMLPGAPTLSEKAIETSGIPVYHKYFNYFDDSEIDGKFTYEGYSAKMPNTLYDLSQKAVRNQLLHASSYGFIKNSGGTLLYERPIEHENYPGVEVAGNLENNQLYVRGRFFFVGDQLIGAYAVTTSDFEKSPHFDKYFNSLHFSKAAPKRTVEEPNWERIELKDVACATVFPGSPKYRSLEADGNVYKGYSLATDDNDDPNTDYLFQYSDLGLDPAKVESKENAKTFLHAVVEGYYQELNGHLIREEHIEQNGYRGVSATMTEATGNMLISVRFFIVKGYRVSAIVYSTPQFDDNPNMRKFFNSITLPKD